MRLNSPLTPQSACEAREYSYFKMEKKKNDDGVEWRGVFDCEHKRKVVGWVDVRIIIMPHPNFLPRLGGFFSANHVAAIMPHDTD